MTALLPRFALAGVAMALAAAVFTTTGGSGFGGALGSLFGYQASLKAPPEPVVVAAAPAAGATIALRAATPAPSRPSVRAHARIGHRPGSTRNAPAGQPGTGTAPAPAPPAPLPSPPAAPAPAPQQPHGAVQQVEQATRQVTAPAPAPAAQPVAQALQTVDQVCALAGGCP